MIENLRLSSSGPLQETELRSLGRINVVCGRNNSGKSTLLLAAADRARATVGKHLTADDVQRIFEDSCAEMPWDREYPILRGEFQQIIEDVSSTRDLWWRNEHQEFYRDIANRISGNGLLSGYGTLPRQAIFNAFRTVFPTFPTVLVIPAKRSLPLTDAINSGQQVSPHGSGILNRLFYLKNQITHTAEYQRYIDVRQAFESISSGFSFDVLLVEGNHLTLHFSTPSGDWIDAASAGLGLQDLLVLLYLSLEPAYEVLHIEEPESHLHPEFQRKLLNFLRHSTNKQYFLTTHSNVFLDVNLVDRVFFTSHRGHINVDDATSRATILNDLGYEVTDNLVSDLVILVEGPSDSAFLQAILGKTSFAGERVIKYWPLGGDNMEHLDLSVFAERNRLIALIDHDPGSDPVRKRFITKCEHLGIPIHRLKRYSIESYFSLRALREFYKGQIPKDIQELPHDRPAEDVLKVGLKRNSRRIGELMRLDELAGTDLLQFIEKVEKLSTTTL